jgi:hypothetical protein
MTPESNVRANDELLGEPPSAILFASVITPSPPTEYIGDPL